MEKELINAPRGQRPPNVGPTSTIPIQSGDSASGRQRTASVPHHEAGTAEISHPILGVTAP